MPHHMMSPLQPLGPDGSPRTIGLEIEFSNLDCRSAAELVLKAFGGDILEEDPYRFGVLSRALGDFRVELDTHYAHPQKNTANRDRTRDGLEAALCKAVGDVTSLWLPV